MKKLGKKQWSETVTARAHFMTFNVLSINNFIKYQNAPFGALMIRLQWQAPGWRFFFKVLQKNFEKSISTVNIFIEYESRAYDFACKK